MRLPGPGASGLAARHAASAGIRHTFLMNQPGPHDDHRRTSREADWLRENAEALESSNRYVERHGLPLWSHSVLGGAEGAGEQAIMDFAHGGRTRCKDH